MFPPIDYIIHTYECDIALKLVTGMLSQSLIFILRAIGNHCGMIIRRVT